MPVILIGTLVILSTTISNYSNAGECTNMRDIRPKSTQKLSLLMRLYNYFFEVSKTAEEQNVSFEQKANEERLSELDKEFQKLAELKATASKTASELSGLKKEQEKLKQDPLMRLYEYSRCAYRYQKAYDVENKPFHPTTKVEIDYFSHEDDDFSRDYVSRKSVIKLPTQAYSANYEFRKHTVAYKAADCILATGDKLIKTVLVSGNLSSDIQKDFMDGIAEAKFEYHDQNYYRYAKKLGSMSWKLIEDHNKPKFTSLMERRKKLSKLIATLEGFLADVRIQYDNKLDSMSSKLASAMDTITTMKEKFGLEVSSQCVASLSKICSLRSNPSDSTCQAISAWQQNNHLQISATENSGSRF